MSAWPDGFDVWVYHGRNGWFASIQDNRPTVTSINLPGYTTRQEAELAALDWIQRRIGAPETVPQPVLRDCSRSSWQCEKDYIDDVLERLADLEVLFPTPRQADYADERQHIAAADCNIYRCGLIGALRQSLQAEKELIQEKLWENR